MIKVFVGYDPREAVAYHTFCQSVISRTKSPVSFTPVTGEQRDGSNRFIYARFLVPWMCDFRGNAIFVDGDMTCLEDISRLQALYDDSKAVQVVQHGYVTRFSVKYWGQKNESYPRKNWSSVMIWNCGHESNRILTPEYIREHKGSFLHRFAWLDGYEIGSLPVQWNWLAQEYPYSKTVKLVHHTIGLPIDPAGVKDPWSETWENERRGANRYSK